MAKVLTMSPAMLPMPWDGLILRSKPRRRRPAKRDWRAAVESVRSVVCSDSARRAPQIGRQKFGISRYCESAEGRYRSKRPTTCFSSCHRGARPATLSRSSSRRSILRRSGPWSQGPGILCLLRQLSHGRAVRCHRLTWKLPHSPGRGRRGENHERADRRALPSQAGAACGRYRAGTTALSSSTTAPSNAPSVRSPSTGKMRSSHAPWRRRALRRHRLVICKLCCCSVAWTTAPTKSLGMSRLRSWGQRKT
jgi:hypothetical protein